MVGISLLSAGLVVAASVNAAPMPQKRIAQVIADSTTKWVAACTKAGGQGQCSTISQAAFTTLLAAGKNCDQQDQADNMIDLAKKLKNDPDMIKFAQIFAQQPRNAPDSLQVPYCQKAPRNAELNGFFHCQFQGTTKTPKFSGDQTGNLPLGVAAVNPPGSCPASKTPVADGAQLTDTVSSPGTPQGGSGAAGAAGANSASAAASASSSAGASASGSASATASGSASATASGSASATSSASATASSATASSSAAAGPTPGRRDLSADPSPTPFFDPDASRVIGQTPGRRSPDSPCTPDANPTTSSAAAPAGPTPGRRSPDNACPPPAGPTPGRRSPDDLSSVDPSPTPFFDPNASRVIGQTPGRRAEASSTSTAVASSTASSAAAASSTASSAAAASSTASSAAAASSTASSAAAASSSAVAAPGAKPFTLSNGQQAQQGNAKFAKAKAGDACTTGEQGCIGNSFAQCVGGKLQAASPCSGGTQCFVLPLVNKAGTSVTCDTPADAAARIAATGATGGITGSG